MKIIYTWGDSHVSMFDETYRALGAPKPDGEPKVIFIGRSNSRVYTAYAIDTHDDEIQEVLSSIDFKENDEMWFMFGEIDVRFHIFYHHQKLGVPLDSMIESVAERYVVYVGKLRKQGFNIHILSVVPTQPVPGPYLRDPTYNIKDWIRDGGNNLEDRIYITENFNRILEVKCRENDVPFRNIYHYLVHPTTRCNIPEMTRDGMHYKYIGDFIIDELHLD